MRKEKTFPLLSALNLAGRGFTDDSLSDLVKTDSKETDAAFTKLMDEVERAIPDYSTCSDIEELITAFASACEWLAFQNGARVALALQDELDLLRPWRLSGDNARAWNEFRTHAIHTPPRARKSQTMQRKTAGSLGREKNSPITICRRCR